MSDATTIPPPPDPTDANLTRTTGDKIGGFLGAISRPGSALGTISEAFGRAHEKRLAEAKMYHDVMVEKLSHPAYGDEKDPEHQKTVDAYNAAEAAYLKLAPDPDTKKQMQMRSAVAKHHVASQGAQPATQKPGGISPPPATGDSATPSTPSTPPAISPPPPIPNMTDVMAGIPGEMQKDADQRTIKMEQAKQDMLTKGKIAEETAKAKSGSGRHLQHVPVTNPKTGKTEPGSYDPGSGEYLDQQGNIIDNAQLAAKQFSYAGGDGKPLIGWQIGDTLYDQEMNPLPAGTEKFVAWMQPRTTTTEGFKSEVQPDGSTKLVPTETSSTTVRGGAGKGGGADKTTPAPPTAKVKGAGTTVGGKVPTGVSKAYEAYNGAQERMAVMQDAMPRALKGDQQAMLNLLANHVGMTMGLQKGARITQGVYSEAEQSAPILARVNARFDKDGYLTGVVLTPDQMRQMIDLAKVRLDQDKAAWQREVSAAKGGYGMTPPPVPKGSESKGAAPKTAGDYLDSIGVKH